ncbi:hypothetical protein SLA2020_487890 [Shorea laevis]
MDCGDWESSSDTEIVSQDDNDEEGNYYAIDSKSKLQFRKEISKGRWDNKLGMAEVVEKKGKMWVTTGIVRGGKTYCTIEETLFLAEIGALLLLDENDKCLSLTDIFEKVAQEVSGCSWEYFEVYRHLKALGYVVGRHGVPWTKKDLKVNAETVLLDGSPEENDSVEMGMIAKNHIIELFNNMHIDEATPTFDVYLPNSKFRKSSPGDPSFVLCLCRSYHHPPSKEEIKVLEHQCGNIPLKFCQVENGRVSLFSFDQVELPVLP